MSTGGSLQLSHEFGLFKNYGMTNKFKSVEMKSQTHLLSVPFSSCASQQDAWSLYVSDMMYKPLCYDPYRYNIFMCQSLAVPSSGNEVPLLKSTTLALTRSFNAMCERPLVLQLVPAVGIIAFAVWGLGPLMCHSRNLFLHRNDRNWKKSRTYYVFTSYLQPLLLWTGSTLVCRVLDPVVLPSEASQAVKQRLLNFIRTLSTVLAFAYCLSSLIQQIQKILLETKNPAATRNMGFNFAGKAVFTAVWIAAFSLFMELLGFSAQKWITAGSLGTVLLTIAGQEIFTNFLSSIIIHATRPFVVNEWIQTNVEGYDVSGTAEHVGWWTPTIIRGEDREAVHIPNHIFTVNVVRNLSQKTHWRIKTHLAISHLDVRKIHKIVGEMRKVLAKNPQVEQQRLHRRVFLEYINPENQALMILVSCFVKTSHFEEYLRVKEAILLDLLGVISHYRARLATPIRTVQRMYGDADVENVPFADTVITRAGAATARHPLLLIKPSSKIDGHDEAKAHTPPGSNEEQTTMTIAVVAEPIVASVTEVTDSNSSDKQQEQEKKANSGDDLSKSTKAEGPDGMELGSKADSQKLPLSEGDDKAKVHDTHESERLPAKPSPVARPVWENNIVLGVALEGSKRTLPIEEGIDPVPTPREAREVAGCRNGSRAPSFAKDKKSWTSAAPGAAAAGLQDQVES